MPSHGLSQILSPHLAPGRFGTAMCLLPRAACRRTNARPRNQHRSDRRSVRALPHGELHRTATRTPVSVPSGPSLRPAEARRAKCAATRTPPHRAADSRRCCIACAERRGVASCAGAHGTARLLRGPGVLARRARRATGRMLAGGQGDEEDTDRTWSVLQIDADTASDRRGPLRDEMAPGGAVDVASRQGHARVGQSRFL